jgi:hypothetical protein
MRQAALFVFHDNTRQHHWSITGDNPLSPAQPEQHAAHLTPVAGFFSPAEFILVSAAQPHQHSRSGTVLCNTLPTQATTFGLPSL